MSAHTGERRAEAVLLADEVADTVRAEGATGVTWYRMLRDIQDTLADTDRSDREALADAATMLSAMYDGPRNFADFYLQRSTPTERVRVNQEFSARVARLTKLLEGRDDLSQ